MRLFIQRRSNNEVAIFSDAFSDGFSDARHCIIKYYTVKRMTMKLKLQRVLKEQSITFLFTGFVLVLQLWLFESY